MAIEATKETSGTLVDVIDRILDKGVELLGIKIRAALASFETAAKYGLEFPSGTNVETAAWKEAMVAKEDCPQCSKRVPVEELISAGCPWCGWVSAKAKAIAG